MKREWRPFCAGKCFLFIHRSACGMWMSAQSTSKKSNTHEPNRQTTWAQEKKRKIAEPPSEYGAHIYIYHGYRVWNHLYQDIAELWVSFHLATIDVIAGTGWASPCAHNFSQHIVKIGRIYFVYAGIIITIKSGNKTKTYTNKMNHHNCVVVAKWWHTTIENCLSLGAPSSSLSLLHYMDVPIINLCVCAEDGTEQMECKYKNFAFLFCNRRKKWWRKGEGDEQPHSGKSSRSCRSNKKQPNWICEWGEWAFH